MRSNLGRTVFTVLGTLASMTTALALAASASQNLVVNGDFENGNTGFTTGYTLGDVSGPGTYFIGTNPSTAPGAFNDWCNCPDHTLGKGKMMIVNGANSDSTPVWEETVSVAPSTSYIFSFWGVEVDHDSSSLPRLSIKINGKPIGVGTIPEKSADNGGQWQNYQFVWNSGTSRRANLALFDLTTDSTWNDFAIDDISFDEGHGNAASATGNASSSGPITTIAQVTVKNEHEVEVPLKPQERVAFMFMDAFSSIEGDCDLHLHRRCSIAEMVAGPKASDWHIERLKYDPSRDTNYKYTVTIDGRSWTASAVPQRAGLGGFFVDGSSFMAKYYYNAKGPASASDTYIPDTSIAGELFHVN
jgi:hypothetical protein